MANWAPFEWSMFFIALGTLFNTALIALAAFIANLAKIRSEDNAVKIDDNTKAVNEKIDENTVLTKAGSVAAATNAKTAVDTAKEAADTAKVAVEVAKTVSEKTREIANSVNGGLDERVATIVKRYIDPIVKDIQEIKSTVMDMRRGPMR